MYLIKARSSLYCICESFVRFLQMETPRVPRQCFGPGEGPETRNKLRRLNGRRRNNCVEVELDLSEREEGKVGTKSSALGSSSFAFTLISAHRSQFTSP